MVKSVKIKDKMLEIPIIPVSYTHLDVYKRQAQSVITLWK